MNLKNRLTRVPFFGRLATRLGTYFLARRFPGSSAYWVRRYQAGGDSGRGSYDKFAQFKAEVLNDFVKSHKVKFVIEYGCGDGNQLRYAMYPSYLGFDISDRALTLCREIFVSDPTKSFKTMEEYQGERADLTLSLDVLYHLTEDHLFEAYLKRLFHSSHRYVIIYSSDTDEQAQVQAPHIKHRKFTRWVEKNLPSWNLIQHIPNRFPYNGNEREGSFAEFYIYEKA